MVSETRSRGSIAKYALILAALAFVVSQRARADAIPGLPCGNGQVCLGSSGGTATGSGSGLHVTNSLVSQVGSFYSQGTLGKLNLTTGAIISGSLAAGGLFDSGSLSIAALGNWSGYTGVLFSGTFSGPVTWALVGPCNSSIACTYSLTGMMTGTWASGQVFTGTTTLTFKTGHGAYTGGSLTSVSGSMLMVTPEPGTLSLLGSGVVGIVGLVRRKMRRTRPKPASV